MKKKWGLFRLGEWSRGLKTKRSRRVLAACVSLLLVLNIVVTALPAAVFAAAASVSSAEALVEACTAGGDIRLSGSFELNETITLDGEDKSVNLSSASNNYTISRAQGFTGEMFRLTGGATLTLGNGVVLDGGSGSRIAHAPLISVDGTASTLNLAGGSLKNNLNRANSSLGGAVVVNGGTFNMSGGEISGNKACSGGGVALTGGASFTMSGGTIGGRSESATEGTVGGAVEGAVEEATGGTIKGNKAFMGNGGGIYAEKSSVSVTGGEIIGNSASEMGGGGWFNGCPTLSFVGKATTGGEGCPIVVSANCAPIGAGLYYSGKLDSSTEGRDYSLGGAVYISGNMTSTGKAYSLPTGGDNGTECNLFMATMYDTPKLMSLESNSRIGFYPVQSGTTLSVIAGVEYLDLFENGVLNCDHNKGVITPSTIDNDNGKRTITFTSATVTILDDYLHGSVVNVGGTEIDVNNGTVSKGFPVRLYARPHSGYKLTDGSFYVKNTNEAHVYTPPVSSEYDGMWYIFTDGNNRVNAKFEQATIVATYNDAVFTSLSDAFAAANGDANAEITLLADTELSVPVNVQECQTITLKTTTGKKVYRASGYTDEMFTVNEEGKLVLDGVELNGKTSGLTAVAAAAPAVIVNGGILELKNGAAISNNNNVSGNGGAVYLENGELRIIDGTLMENSAAKGGAVYMTGNSLLRGDGNDTTYEIDKNSYTLEGGGVWCDGGVIEDCNVSRNQPGTGAAVITRGGGIYIANGKLDGVIVGLRGGGSLTENAEYRNDATQGAGVFAQSCVMNDVTVRNNHAGSGDKGAGVYHTGSLTMSGKVIIKDNVLGTSTADNLYIDNSTAATVPVARLSGMLEDGSSIGISVASTALANIDGKTLLECVKADADDPLPVIIGARNVSAISLDDPSRTTDDDDDCPTLQYYSLINSDGSIELAKNDKCVTVNLSKEAGGEEFDDCSALLPSSVSFKKDDGSMQFTVTHPSLMKVSVNCSDKLICTETKTVNGMQTVTLFEITAAQSAVGGGQYNASIKAFYDYKEGTLSARAPLTKKGSLYDADNLNFTELDADNTFYYNAVQLHPGATLDARFVAWSHSEANAEVKSEMSKVKPSTITLSGYTVLTPKIDETTYGNATPLAGNTATAVHKVTISVDVSDLYEDGSKIDIISYNGVKKDTANNTGGAVLHEDLYVQNGRVSFSAERGNGSTTDTIYVALLDRADNEAKIGANSYRTLAEAFAAAQDNDVINVLRDCTIHSTLVVPSNVKVSLVADKPVTITRSAYFDGAMIFVDGESTSERGELKLSKITLDGGARIVTALPLVSEGGKARAAVIANHGKLDVISDCTITGGRNAISQGSSGSAPANSGGSAVADSVLTQGGAVYNAATGEANINGKLTGNTAGWGGAVYNLGTMTLSGSTATGNVSLSNGGAIYNNGTLTIKNSCVSDNTCSGSGIGGVYNAQNGVLHVSGNTAVTSNTNGGGILSDIANNSSSSIIIDAPLNNSAKLGITVPNTVSSEIAVGGTTVNDVSAYHANFFSDVDNLTIVANMNKVYIKDSNAKYIDVEARSDGNGTVSPQGSFRVLKDSKQVFTFSPTGDGSGKAFTLDTVTVNGTQVAVTQDENGAGTWTYTLDKISQKTEVAATFKHKPGFVIVPNKLSTIGGDITPDTLQVINSTESKTFTMTPEEGYYISKLTLDGVNVLGGMVKNTDGTYSYTVSGLTKDKTDLDVEFSLEYDKRKLVDAATGVSLEGDKIHHEARLVVESLQENYPSVYNQMKEKLTNNDKAKEYILQGYEIRLVFDNEIEMAGVPKFNDKVSLVFNLGSSMNGKFIHVYHGTESDKPVVTPKVPEDGIIRVGTESLSPFTLVVHEEISGNSSNNDDKNNNDSSNNDNNGKDGDGAKTGDDGSDNPLTGVLIALSVLAAMAAGYVFYVQYLPRVKKWVRAKLAATEGMRG